MKSVIVILALITLIPLMQPVRALSGYDSGFTKGLADARDSCQHPDGCHWYILEPGKGFKFHSMDFVRGYVDGFCSLDHHGGSDADQASFDCARGPDSASWVD